MSKKTEKAKDHWDDRVLVTVNGRSYWVSPDTAQELGDGENERR